MFYPTELRALLVKAIGRKELASAGVHLVARTWIYATRRSSRRGVLAEIRRLVVRMAVENPTWGYTRIQGALNPDFRFDRGTLPRRTGVSP